MTIASAAEGSCVAISAAIAGDDKDATIASSEAPKTLIEKSLTGVIPHRLTDRCWQAFAVASTPVR